MCQERGIYINIRKNDLLVDFYPGASARARGGGFINAKQNDEVRPMRIISPARDALIFVTNTVIFQRHPGDNADSKLALCQGKQLPIADELNRCLDISRHFYFHK